MSRIQLTLACTLSLVWASVAHAQMGPSAGMVPGGNPPGAFGGIPPQQMAMPAPPMRLPPGVVSEGGLLYYNGKPYSEGGQGPANPYQFAGFGHFHGGYPQMAYSPVGGCPDCYGGCPQCQGDDDWFGGFAGKMGTGWTAGAEILAFTRDNGTSVVMAQNLVTNSVLFNSDELDYDYEAGGRVFVSYMGASGIQYEAVYLRPADFNTNATIDGPFNLRIPFPLAAATFDYFGGDLMNFTYDSEIQTAEANIIYPWSEVQLLVGYRYFGLDEQMVLSSTNTFLNSTSDYPVSTSNQMHGAQIGVLGQYEALGLLNFDLAAKFGVMCNTARQNQTVYDLDNSVIFRNTSGSRTDVAFVSELRAQAVIPLGPAWSIQSGYSIFFINGVALAPDQYDFTNTATSGTGVDQRGNFILHGAHLGLTLRW